MTMSTKNFPVFVVKASQIAIQSMTYLALLCAGVVCALAQDGHSQMARMEHEQTAVQKDQASALIKIVRESTERFKDVAVAEAEGYTLQFGCVSGPDAGAMGLHYVNFPLVADGIIDPTKPEIVIYEPLPNGKLQLVGADFLVL